MSHKVAEKCMEELVRIQRTRVVGAGLKCAPVYDTLQKKQVSNKFIIIWRKAMCNESQDWCFLDACEVIRRQKMQI